MGGYPLVDDFFIVTTRCNKMMNHFVATKEHPNDVVTSSMILIIYYLFIYKYDGMSRIRASKTGIARCDAPQIFFYNFLLFFHHYSSIKFSSKFHSPTYVENFMKIKKRWADPHKIDENDPFFDLLYVTTHRPTRDQ